VVLIVCKLDLQLPMQSVPITTKVVSSNLTLAMVGQWFCLGTLTLLHLPVMKCSQNISEKLLCSEI
jgi:hypothetical protein